MPCQSVSAVVSHCKNNTAAYKACRCVLARYGINPPRKPMQNFFADAAGRAVSIKSHIMPVGPNWTYKKEPRLLINQQRGYVPDPSQWRVLVDTQQHVILDSQAPPLDRQSSARVLVHQSLGSQFTIINHSANKSHTMWLLKKLLTI